MNPLVHRTAPLILVAALGLAATGDTGASTPTALLTDARTSLPNSEVPNITDFGYASGFFSGFGRPVVAADGTTWIASADATAFDAGAPSQPIPIEVIIRGDGSGITTVVAGGGPAPTGGGDLSPSFDTGLRINSNGDLTFREAAADGAPWRLFLFDAATRTWSVELAGGDPVPGFPDQSFRTFTDIAGLTTDQRIALRTSDTAGPAPNNENDFLLIGDTLVAQTGVTVPTPQIDDPAQPLQGDFFTLGNFDVTEDGRHFAYDANLDDVPSSRDRIFVVDGTVVLQEDAPIAGLPVHADSVRQASSYLDASGTWSLVADLQDDTDILLVDGEVVAMTGDPVPGSPGELFDDTDGARTFGSVVTRGPSEYAFTAETDNPDQGRDNVLVHVHGDVRSVLVRTGDAIDLDGDGALDDALVLGLVGKLAFVDDAVLVNVNLVRADTTPLGQALVAIDLPCPGDVTGDVTGDGAVDIADLLFVLNAFGQHVTGGPADGDVDNSGVVDFADVLGVLGAFGSSC